MRMRDVVVLVTLFLGVFAGATIAARVPVVRSVPLAAVVAILMTLRHASLPRTIAATVIAALAVDSAYAAPIGVRAMLLLAALVLTVPLGVALRTNYHAGLAVLFASVLGGAEYLAAVLPPLRGEDAPALTALLPDAAAAMMAAAILAILLRPRADRSLLL
ncbi:MAG: hypothetical protein Q7T01_00575 [bacterium]|nr:hypothetical protein [bacterium]